MFVWVFITYALIIAHETCKAELCPEDPRLYIELGCKRDNSGGQQCSNSYICPDFTSLNQTQCHFKGIIYNVGEHLRKTDNPPCEPGCMCSNITYPRQFQCHEQFCPTVTPNPGCVAQNTLDQCCDTHKSICGIKAKNLPTCTFLGKVYQKGNIMYSPSGCYKCLCDENFDNTTDYLINKNCKPVYCDIEINALYNFQIGCIPIFYEDYCCPTAYRCPANGDSVVRASQSTQSSQTQGTCTFGNLVLNPMDKLNKDRDCVICTCTNPPMVQCILQNGCDTGPSESEPSESESSEDDIS